MIRIFRNNVSGFPKIKGWMCLPTGSLTAAAACMVLVILLLVFPGCKKAVLTAPDNSTLIVTVNPPVIPLGGQAVVRVVGFKASGTPVPDGTVIFFSTDIGTIDSRKETQNGEAEALFKSTDNRSGTATITITSGNATVSPESITITIGTSGLSSLSISADPPVLPVGGGATVIRVTALDADFNPIANIPVSFTTDAGHLNSSGNPVTTNTAGVAQDLLQTTDTAVVTAASGDKDASITVTVTSNDSPTASFVYSPSSPKVNENVYFNASASSDPDGSIIAYRWDFGDGGTGSGVTVTHKYRAAGSYTVVLVVEDNSGYLGSASLTLSAANGSAPNPSFVYSPLNPAVNETIHFNASGSTDSDGYIASFEWDFGDGSKSSGQTVNHSYNKSGSFVVLLKVTDDDDNSASTSQTITIGQNEAPVASFSYSPTSPGINEDIYFSAASSYDPDGTITSYNWNFGDGTTASGQEVTHRFTISGTFTVFLQVTDNSGNTGSTNKTVTISANQNPTAAFVYSPSSPAVGDSVYFDASNSSDPDGSIVSFQWNFGDGHSGSGQQIQHRFNNAGTYTVVLVVTDNSGNTDSVDHTVTVSDNTTPVALFTFSPESPSTSDTITFNASASYDPDGTITNYTWDFGDTSSGSGVIVYHQYSAAGTYTVWLRVTDSDGISDSISIEITVD